MLFKKSDNQAVDADDLPRVMNNLATHITSVSNVGMFSFMEEVISQDESAKAVEEKALKQTCLSFNTIFAILKIKSSSLDYSLKCDSIDIIKKALWMDLLPDFGSSPYFDEAKEAQKKLAEPGGGAEYGLLISEMFFSMYDSLVEEKSNKTQFSYVKDICKELQLKSIHSLALNIIVNQALVAGVADIEKASGTAVFLVGGGAKILGFKR